MASSEVDWKPRVGMEFDNVEAAWQFWVVYGEKAGFGVRKQYLNKNKKKKDGSITSCRFVCCKEGHRKADKRDFETTNHRAETRTECKARISLVVKNGKFVIHEFVEEHNHPLLLTETMHMLASQCKVYQLQACEIELAKDSGLQQRASFQPISTHAGDKANLGHTQFDAKNLPSKRQRNMMYGEAGFLLQYFQRQLQEKPSFYHEYQLDIDEKITNVFWADAEMMQDYGYFGDVVSLDTTYCTNNANRPLALFSGFNHYKEAVIFGAALLYDETVESFQWLFQTFLEAHGQKKPKTIFTNQDQVMAKALGEVMSETRHGLCTWQLIQSGTKHLGNLMKKNSHFLIDFKNCIYEYDEELQFEAAWCNLVAEYNVTDNNWVKSVYAIKEKWAACHMKKAFTLGMRNTQLNESLNSDFKVCMEPDVDVIEFFEHFERVVEEKRYNELICEYDAQHKLSRLQYQHSPLLMQLAQVYTPPLFDLFQNEFDLFLAACIKERNESQLMHEYVITMVNREGEWLVSFDPVQTSICCSCKKFETFGILCCHALKVFEAKDIKVVPDQYILRRWTRDARSGFVHDIRGKEVHGDPKLSSARRFRQLCAKMIRLASEVSSCEELYSLVDKGVDDLYKQIMEVCLKQGSMGDTTTRT